ncbi:hypothetical protein BDF20DRAFT_800062, partial [Mycotypha africana]|uniref:uncharacterized protein n=1 Tax=Mycotypha africana TaxID=64632 RepID=UPI0023012FE7
MAKEDHIYRLNHILNTLFRFNIKRVDADKLKSAIELGQFLFDTAGLEYRNLPRPIFFPHLSSGHPQPPQPAMYPALLLLLHAPRPTKFKPMCHNCNTKPASRRRLCVACYRYQLKHGEARPLRLIVANRPGPRGQGDLIHSCKASYICPPSLNNENHKSNLSMETHQWYRNLCGDGNWCETCKSYYLRHTKVRPPELFVKAAKRKVDIRSLVNWKTWSWDEIPVETIEAATMAYFNTITPPPPTPSSTSS